MLTFSAWSQSIVRNNESTFEWVKKTHAMKLLESGSKDNWPLMERILHFPPWLTGKSNFWALSPAPPSILGRRIENFHWFLRCKNLIRAEHYICSHAVMQMQRVLVACTDQSCIFKLLAINWALIASWKAAVTFLFSILHIAHYIFPPYLLRCCDQGHATCPDKSCILKLLVVNWALIASWKAASISLFCLLLTILLTMFPLYLLTVYCNATAAISSPCNWLPRQEVHSQSGGCLQLSLDCQLGCCGLPQVPNLYFAPISFYFDGRAQSWWSCQWFQRSILIPILPKRWVRRWL